ncbi:hypothetical protein CDD83_3739 [Cordyceps sp. RAO-2017]|nr:hypothetical protein CDD83_3739 [Cordyceps sp. RAO-2017]
MGKSTFTISAEANTDIWKKPPSRDDFNAPYQTHSKRPVSSFRAATLTFTATYSQQYDQAGILLLFRNPSSSSSSSAPAKWIKAGIEVLDGTPRLSTVGCDNWADWSVAPAPDPAAVLAGRRPITLRLEARSSSLWVYHLGDGDRHPLRELCWPFGEPAADGWELEVAAVVARPAKEAPGRLEAIFADFDVEWEDGGE